MSQVVSDWQILRKTPATVGVWRAKCAFLRASFELLCSVLLMRMVSIVVTGVFALSAILTGLLAAIVAALTGAVLVSLRRLLLGSTRDRQAWEVPGHMDHSKSGEVIEITATEVAAERTHERLAG